MDKNRATYASHADPVHQSTPKHSPPRTRNLEERDVTSDMDRLNLHTKTMTQDQMLSEQENRREAINVQMSGIPKLNDRLNFLGETHSIYWNSSPKGLDDLEQFHMINIVASTSPMMLHQGYATRLEMMSRIQERLDKVLRDKSEQVTMAQRRASVERALETSRISLRQLGEPANQDLSGLPQAEFRRLQRY